MQYHLQIFETEDHWDFRVVDKDGEPWFVLADVCRALDLKSDRGSYAHHATKLDPDEKDIIARDSVAYTTTRPDIVVGKAGGSYTIVNESGLWNLIFRSEKPEAKRLKKWVTAEVLPTIRKTGSYRAKPNVPAFIRRANENWDRTDLGYFSIVSELYTRLWGRFELAGHIIADRAPDGTENRPDVSVGKTFAAWLKKHHPSVSAAHSYYPHKTDQWEGPARQYPNTMLHLYLEFVEEVWIPKYAEDYFKRRDAKALPYLPTLLRPPRAA